MNEVEDVPWCRAQAIEKLKLDNEAPTGGARPTALGMHSCVGTEYVAFKKPLALEGKVAPARIFHHGIFPGRSGSF